MPGESRRPFRHIVFDLDGTLVDTQEDLAAATNFVLERFGLPRVSMDVLREYVGHGARALLQRALGPDHAGGVEEGVGVFLEYYGAHLLDRTRPYPGIEALLERLRRHGRGLSALTNKPEGLSRRILEGLGLAGHFGGLVGGDTLAVRKPEAAGLQHLCRLAGASPEETLLVGDSVVDVQTGRAGGVAVCGVSWGFGLKGLDEMAPDFLVREPEEIFRIAVG